MMNYPVQAKVAASRGMKSDSEQSSRRVPPPPPPRGVTLRAASVTGVAPSKMAAPSSSLLSSSSSSVPAVNRLHLKQQPAHQSGYLETRYAYSVNGALGSAAQASAAAAFFARASQKLKLESPQRRKRHGTSDGSGSESPIPASVHRFGTDFSGLLRRQQMPPPPAHLLRRLGTRENPGVGKVRVMLRVSGDPGASALLSVDKKRKQLTLQEPGQHVQASDGPEDRRIGVAAPKMFAFDGLFTSEDSQADVASSVLSDIVTAVINGSDGCVFCYGHAQVGKTTTMIGSCTEQAGPGLIPTAISWLFRGIGEQKSKTGARFSVRVSAVEIAGPAEVLRDLLAPHATESEESPGVYLRDDPLLGTQLQNQSELRAPTAEKAAFYLDAALAARTDSSSPDARFSHLLYTLHVYQYSVDRTPTRGGNSSVAGGRSRLHLLDLGSCQQSGRVPANHHPANSMTLSNLGNVLVALFNGQRHLPHREHKITQVLRECLGSLTCQAALIAHVGASSSYSETLSAVQMASRVHRMRRRRAKYTTGNGSGGSAEENRLGLSRSSGGESSTGSADPSSSEQSCDTVIYVGPIDDATDGEHPPVYLPSLNSGDNRCAMSRALRGSIVDRPAQQQPLTAGKSPLHQTKKDSGSSASPSRSPQIARKAPKTETNQQPASKPVNTEEQWVDGPRFHKSRISQARMQVGRHQRETWVDGPTAATTAPFPQAALTAVAPTSSASIGYGFMDNHKQGMIRQWVETQSAQVQRHAAMLATNQVWIDAQPRPMMDQGTPVKVLTVFKTCTDDEDDEPDRPAESAVVDSVRSPVISRHQPATPSKHARRKADPVPSQEAPMQAAAPTPAPVSAPAPTLPAAPAKQAEEKPRGASDNSASAQVPTVTSLTLDQLYTQCEQLAESLDQEERDVEGTVGDCSTDDMSDDLSAALDVTSEQVSIGCDSWRRVRHSQAISEESEPVEANLVRYPGVPVLNKACDYSPEYIEVEEPDEPVPTQDSCLQVTEEDIALSMMQVLEAKINCDVRSISSCSMIGADSDDHPLRALSQDNLTVISHFTGETYSQGTASEWEPIGPSVLDSVTLGSSSIENPNFYQAQLEHLAKLHQQLYQQSVAGNTALHTLSLGGLTSNCNIGSFKELPLLSQDWANAPVRTSTTRPIKNQEARKALVSTIGMELERELGIQDTASIPSAVQSKATATNTNLSSLRHPDGASDPHLDKHSIQAYESACPSEDQEQRLPGNGASTSDPEEDSNAKAASATVVSATNGAYSAALAPVATPSEKGAKPEAADNGEASPKPVPHKTPKLSRFFSSSKNKQSQVAKRNTATSMSGSPVFPQKVSSSSAKSSPKPEKRSKSHERAASGNSKHNSPAKASSKSPSRLEVAPSLSMPSSPKSFMSKASSKKDKLKTSSSHKSPKKDSKSSWGEKSTKRDVKSYGFSYESSPQTAPSSLCPSEGYESGGSDSGVHLSATSPIKSHRHLHQTQVHRQHLMPIGEMSRKNFICGTNTSGSGGSGGSTGHYESSGYESVMRDSECSSLGSSSHDSDREPTPMAMTLSSCKPSPVVGQSSSCTIL